MTRHLEQHKAWQRPSVFRSAVCGGKIAFTTSNSITFALYILSLQQCCRQATIIRAFLWYLDVATDADASSPTAESKAWSGDRCDKASLSRIEGRSLELSILWKGGSSLTNDAEDGICKALLEHGLPFFLALNDMAESSYVHFSTFKAQRGWHKQAGIINRRPWRATGKRFWGRAMIDNSQGM